jgi:hypothetical protein
VVQVPVSRICRLEVCAGPRQDGHPVRSERGGVLQQSRQDDRMKNLAIVRYPCTGNAKAVYSAPNLCFHSRAMAARVIALCVVIWFIPRVGLASEALEQKFDGIVVPRLWVQVVPQVS